MSVFNHQNIENDSRTLEKINRELSDIDFALKNLDMEDNFTEQEKNNFTGYTGSFTTREGKIVKCNNGRIISVR